MLSLRDLVENFVGTLRQTNAQPISAPFVAETLTNSFPHSSVFTDAEKTACYMGVAQVAREILRNGVSKEYDANRIGQETLNLPEAALLNDGYSILRGKEPLYIPRLHMTRADMEFVCKRFDNLSEHFARASRALRADWERRNAMAAISPEEVVPA